MRTAPPGAMQGTTHDEDPPAPSQLSSSKGSISQTTTTELKTTADEVLSVPWVGLAPMMHSRTSESSFEVAAVMLSPKGLPVKQLTSDGRMLPVSLHLLRHESGSLSLTWFRNGDSLAKDMRRLTAVRMGQSADKTSISTNSSVGHQDVNCASGSKTSITGPTGRKEKNTTSLELDESLQLVLVWDRDDSGDVSGEGSKGAELVLQASSGAERDALSRCFKLIVSELKEQQQPRSGASSPTDAAMFIREKELTSSGDSEGDSDARSLADNELGLAVTHHPARTEHSRSDNQAGHGSENPPGPPTTKDSLPSRPARHRKRSSVETKARAPNPRRRTLGAVPRPDVAEWPRKALPRRESTSSGARRDRVPAETRYNALLKRLDEAVGRLQALHDRGLAECRAAACLAGVSAGGENCWDLPRLGLAPRAKRTCRNGEA